MQFKLFIVTLVLHCANADYYRTKRKFFFNTFLIKCMYKLTRMYIITFIFGHHQIIVPRFTMLLMLHKTVIAVISEVTAFSKVSATIAIR